MTIDNVNFSQKFKCLPYTITETCNGMVLRRGSVIVNFPKNPANQLVTNLLKFFSTEAGQFIEDIIVDIHEQQKTAILNLIQNLISSRFLVPVDSFHSTGNPAFDVFCWDHQMDPQSAFVQLQQHDWVFVGEDYEYEKILQFSSEFGISTTFISSQGDYLSQLQQLDNNDNLALFAFSDICDTKLLRTLNQFINDHGGIYYPMSIMDYQGSLGPIIVSGESSCFECLRARENAAMFELESQRNAQKGLNPRSVAFPPQLQNVMLSTAVADMVRFLLQLSSPGINKLKVIDLINGKTTTHKILQIPWCKVCGSDEHVSKMASRPLKIFKDEVIRT